MGYDRDELVQIGERFPTDALLDWSGQLVQACRQDLSRLKPRGITEQMLRGIETSREEVRKLGAQQERETPPLAEARREAVAEALEWREEVRGLAKAVFDSETDVQARFRPGVKASQSLPKLIAETGILLGVTREHLTALRGVGADESILTRGESILNRLEEARQRFDEERAQWPKGTLDLHHAQGVLYTRGRFATRIAQVEFRSEPDRLARYTYQPLRRAEAAEARRRPMAAAARS